MPRYTMTIFNSKGEKLRQYSGNRTSVVYEFSLACKNPKWKNCRISWGTSRRVRETFQTP